MLNFLDNVNSQEVAPFCSSFFAPHMHEEVFFLLEYAALALS